MVTQYQNMKHMWHSYIYYNYDKQQTTVAKLQNIKLQTIKCTVNVAFIFGKTEMN